MSKERAEILAKGLVGVSFLASVQFTSRLFTFLLNIALVRYMQDKAAQGVASVQLYLLYTFVLTLSRESIRRVGLRTASSSLHVWEIVNLVWIGIAFGLLLTPLLCTYYIQNVSSKVISGVPKDEFNNSIFILGTAIVLELLSEPFFVVAQAQLEYGFRSKLKAFAILCKCFLTIYTAVALGYHLEAFAWGYLAFSLATLIGYALFFLKQIDSDAKNLLSIKSFYDFVPRITKMPELLTNKQLTGSAVVFTKQTLLKLVLSEGEKFIMIASSLSPDEQSTYGIVFNLGSMFARFLFEPIEEVAYTVFGKLNSLDANFNTGEDQFQLSELLQAMTKLMSTVGLLIVSFGPAYSKLLFHILYGAYYSKTGVPYAFSWYCFYLFVIAINGITEAFVHAVGDENTLNSFNRWMIVCSAVYISCGALLVRFGAIGMILSNCINMGLRIAFSLYYIAQWRDPNLRSSQPPFANILLLFPPAPVLAALFLSFLVTKAGEDQLYREVTDLAGAAIHVFIGLVCLMCCAQAIYKYENAFIKRILKAVKFKKSKET